MQRRHALIVKRHLATNQHIQHHTEAPHIDFRASVHLRVQELGRGEVERAAEGGEVRDGVEEVGETKVDDFDVAGLGDEDVLDFEV